jgi:hypothetical protein
VSGAIYSIADLRAALDSGTLLDLTAPRRKCEMCGRWAGPSKVYVPGSGWYCVGCEGAIQAASRDKSITCRLAAARYNRRVAARNGEVAT